MKGTILLNHTEDTRQVEKEEMSRFLFDILDQMEIPVKEFWETGSQPSVDQKMKLRDVFSEYHIQTIDDLDGSLQIYVDNQKIAEWYKPTYKLKRDLAQRDPKKQLYLEMSVSCWSLFEENATEDETVK